MATKTLLKSGRFCCIQIRVKGLNSSIKQEKSRHNRVRYGFRYKSKQANNLKSKVTKTAIAVSID